MNITKNETDDIITIALEGRLDKLSSPVLDDFLKKEVVKNKNIVFDFKNLEYVSSAGLRILVSCEKQLKSTNKTMEIVNVNNDVMYILKITGFIYMLNIKG